MVMLEYVIKALLGAVPSVGRYGNPKASTDAIGVHCLDAFHLVLSSR